PLDMNKPLWEIYVVEGLDNIEGLALGSYAVVTKIHHAAVDGASLVRFFSSIMDGDNKGTPLLEVPVDTVKPSPAPSMRDMARRAASSNLRSPMKLAEVVLRSMPGVYHSVKQSRANRGAPKPRVPDTRFNVKVSPHKMFDGLEFSLDSFKQIRTLVPGCKINDVVLAVCSGGLRRYLSAHKELPAEPLVAWVPINARSGGAADSEGEGNNITAMTTPIHTDIADPVERLAKIVASTQSSKEAKSGISARLLTDITRHIPAATQVMASRLVLNTAAANRVCNLFVSNVPGAQQQLYMNGARQAGSYGLAPLGEGMGLFIATPSYNGRMSFSLTSTREILPDIEFFMDCLREAHAELLALVGPPAKRKRSPARAAPGSTAPRKKTATAGKKKTARHSA
ncbi:MAG: WS/DGAT domain-containing protein, partial [Parahaliea sp.]